MTTVITPGICLCGNYNSADHVCEYTQGRGWCLRCLADYGDPDCCTPQRLARILVTNPCGCLADEDCRCYTVRSGSAMCGGRWSW